MINLYLSIKSLIKILIFSCILIPTFAYGGTWKEVQRKDPMSGQTITAFVLIGHRYYQKAVPAYITLACRKGKLIRSVLYVHGLTFQYKGTWGLFDSPYTFATLKLDNKRVTWQFSTSSDMSAMIIKKGEIKRILKAESILIEFSDALGTTHIANFHNPGATSDLVKTCGISVPQ